MQILPPALEALIDALGRLPGVGPRTAERYAYYLVRRDPQISAQLSSAFDNLHDNISYCKKIVAVVAEPFDLVALEKTGQYNGTYHVLGGLVSPIDSVGPEQLHIAELMKRIDEDNVEEVILATNASVEGESTALYIQQQIGDRPVKVTRLARGLPIGVDLEYADQITLGRALEGRQAL
jgi:recombination protein RecR